MISSYTSLDLETTGLDPKIDKIIEIGAIKVRDGQVREQFCTLVNPARTIGQTVTKLTGIDDTNVSGAPYIEDVVKPLLDFLGDDILLGHSVLFDYSFVKRAAVNQGFKFERLGIDTLKIAREYLPELPSRALPTLCRYYQIKQRAHRADEDARATHELYLRLCEQFYQEEEKAFTPQQLIYQVKKEAPATQRQKERLRFLLEEKKLGLNIEIDHMTRNEVSRMVDFIRSGQFSRLDLLESNPSLERK